MNPRTLFTWLARAEVVTWTLLLIGMALKYVTRTTELGVSVFGLVHGVVFLAFVLVTVVLWVDQRWPLREVVLVLACAIPPFATRYAERRVERLQALTEELNQNGGNALAIATNVTDPDQVKRLVDAAVQTYGRIDVIINNAGGAVGA